MKTNSSQYLNYITTARGTLIRESTDTDAVFGYRDVSFWLPSTQSWVPASDADKFLVMTSDIESARAEFWARWKKYVSMRFPSLKYVRIENI